MNMNKTASRVGEELSGAAEQVADLGRTAGEKFDEARCGTAKALADAASSVRTTGHQGSEAIDNVAKGVASRLDSTAAYVRRHSVGDMLDNFRQIVRRHPTSFLLGAATIGFLFGSTARRK